MQAVPSSSISPDEIARFDGLAGRWWDPAGPMRPLHRMNPLRVSWIDTRINAGSRILDIGCGAGLAAEALALKGHDVLGLDAAGAAIVAARAHADGRGLRVGYREGTAEQLLAEDERFPVITALEVIEHVSDPGAFLVTLGELLAPGGVLFVSTLNRTRRSWLVAILGAEYALRMLPVGTHDWKRFVAPAELGRAGRTAGLMLTAIDGMRPSLRGWRTTSDLAVNYIAALQRPVGQ